MARIVTVYNTWDKKFRLLEMSNIRWLKISEALAKRGHQVDIATNENFGWWSKRFSVSMGPNLRRVHLARVRWQDYDVVKTLFHVGFETLESFGGADHPWIISKLGSVVGPADMEGIYFYGKIRDQLYATQERINQRSRFITVLTEPAKELWQTSFGARDNLNLVPGGVDREIPPPAGDPFPEGDQVRCLFAGNIYIQQAQPEANRVLVDKLNELGKHLSVRGVRLYLLGPGDVNRLDRNFVTYLGAVTYDQAWNYFHFANVGIVLAAGNSKHHNESSKIYHYLRAGLPVVSEAGFPNDDVVRESKLGYLVEGDALELMADKILDAYNRDWDRDYAIRYVLDNHTWDQRVEVYDRLIRQTA